MLRVSGTNSALLIAHTSTAIHVFFHSALANNMHTGTHKHTSTHTQKTIEQAKIVIKKIVSKTCHTDDDATALIITHRLELSIHKYRSNFSLCIFVRLLLNGFSSTPPTVFRLPQ